MVYTLPDERGTSAMESRRVTIKTCAHEKSVLHEIARDLEKRLLPDAKGP